MKPATLLLLLVLTLFHSVAAQPRPQADVSYELWRARAQTITDDVLKDASSLNSFRRAIVWGKLAVLWWRDDPGRARSWLNNAIEVLEQVPNRESPKERQQRLTTAKFLSPIAASLDPKLSKRLITIVTAVDESTPDSERALIASSLINTAVSMVVHDPKRAAELGSWALRVGTPNDISALLFPLRARDEKLANSLFEQALTAGRQHLDPSLLDSLTYVAFPAEKGIPGQVPLVPDNLRADLLGLHVAYLNKHANEISNGPSSCFALDFITPLLSEFDRLLPQHAPLVRQMVQKCRSQIPTARQELDNPAGLQSPNTIEALLEAAADSDVVHVRTLYQYRAAHLAKDKMDYDQAIKILDNMSSESRELMQSSWNIARSDWAASSAIEHYKNGRLVEMNAVFNAVPAKAQPLAKMMFLDRLPAKKNAEGAPTIQFLNDARTGLRKSDMPDSEKFRLYFDLLHLTMRYQPADATSVLKEAIASLNGGITKDSTFLEGAEFTNVLRASLLDIDEFAVKEILASVTSLEARVQLRFQLLKDTLQRMNNPSR